MLVGGEISKMSDLVWWLGGSLALAGGLVLIGYGVYYFTQNFFGSSGVPIPIQVALPAVVLGFLVLLLNALVDRLKRRKKESLEEGEY